MGGTTTIGAGDTERSRLHANSMRFAAKYRLLDNRVKRPENDLGPRRTLVPEQRATREVTWQLRLQHTEAE